MPRGINIYDESMLQGRLWNPSIFLPAVWWDASDLQTLQGGTGISGWVNKGTVGGVATQVTTNAQPLYRTLNGDNNRGPAYPYLDFDGTNDSLVLSAPIAGTTTQNMYLFTVCRPGSNVGPYKSTVLGSIDGSIWVLRDNGSSSYSQWRFTGTGTTVQDTTFNNGTQIAQVNLTTTAVGARQTAPDAWGVYSRSFVTTTGTGGINFGYNPTYIARGDGSTGITTSFTKTAEILAIPSQIGSNGRQLVEGYLAWKWGLQNLLIATHPFANRPPIIGD